MLLLNVKNTKIGNEQRGWKWSIFKINFVRFFELFFLRTYYLKGFGGDKERRNKTEKKKNRKERYGLTQDQQPTEETQMNGWELGRNE